MEPSIDRRRNEGAEKHLDVTYPVLDHGHVRLVDYMGDDYRVEEAARLSYQKGTRKVSETEGLIRYLMRHSHTTPFEMVRFTFDVKLPIFVARQWMRHRTGSYNEYSLRYSQPMDDCYEPPTAWITTQSQTNRQGGSDKTVEFPKGVHEFIGMQYQQAQLSYEAMVDPKVDLRRELARVVLPLGQYTQFYWTTDLHNLFHFLKLRLDSHAQIETRQYGIAIAEILRDAVPMCWRAFEDYRLNSVTLTALELQVLREHFAGESDGFGDPDEVRKHIKGDREYREAMEKFAKIFGWRF